MSYIIKLFNNLFSFVTNNPFIDSNRNNNCYVNGKHHHNNGLCNVEYENGDKYWRLNGKLHRDNDLPAVEDADGDGEWFVNGTRHRLGGLPAIHFNKEKYYYIYGNQYSYEQVYNYYKILTRFGRYCLRKIRIRRLRKLRWIHGELLCMPPKGNFQGGQDYHQMVSYFMSM